jgi:hypothetical protein
MGGINEGASSSLHADWVEGWGKIKVAVVFP